MDCQEWLKSLHTNSKVMMYDWGQDRQGNWEYRKTECLVERVTKTKIVIWGWYEFSLKDGQSLEDTGGNDCFIVPIDYQESESEKERQVLAAIVSKFAWSKLTLEQLQQIREIAKEKVQMIYSAVIVARRRDGTTIIKPALTAGKDENEAAGKVWRLCHRTFPIPDGWSNHQVDIGMSVETFLLIFPDVKLES